MERQTLRRLPASGGAVFTIRVWLAPMGSLAGHPDRLAAFADAWRTAPEAFRAYKRLDLYNGLVEEEGPPERIFGAPKSERLKQFLKNVS